MSDTVILALIAFAGTVVTSVVGIIMVKLNKLKVVADQTHALTNSAMGAQLSLNASVTRRMADVTKDKADMDVALAAEKLLEEHEEGQRAADAKEPPK